MRVTAPIFSIADTPPHPALPRQYSFLNMHLLWRDSLRRLFQLLSAVVLLPATALSQPTVDFNQDIRPLLSSNCLICHGPDEDERAADLRFDTEEGSRVDLGGYAAIVPGDPDASELIERITTDDEDLRMPPEGKGRQLSEAEVELLRQWIQQGAQYDQHWSYQVPHRPTLPVVQNVDWPNNAIDYFTLAKLESAGLSPASESDRFALARRLSLDLTGLPPTWSEAKEFADDHRPDAYEAYVDSLLAKHSFGERWARVWLDLARYADSAGYADDPPRTIWAFRDYVIRSLNENKPFDQFTLEQIAGDLLDDPTEDQLIATAFHRNTLTNNEGGTNNEEFRNVAVVDRVNTTMAVWMGTTMACAQCHTHKYDPITHEEYFRFFAFFNQTEDADLKDERPVVEIWSDEQKSTRARLQEKIASLRRELNRSTPEIEREQRKWLANLHDEPAWDTIMPTTTESKTRDLVVDDDGWIDVSGHKPVRDQYTLTFPLNRESVTGIRLEVSAKQEDNFVLSQLLASWTPEQERMENVKYARIELPGNKRILQLAEVQVFHADRNIAHDALATQSSTYPGGDAEHAIDGKTNGEFESKSVAHTRPEANPWFELQWSDVQQVDRVVVWNRTDGGKNISQRLDGFTLQLLDANREVIWSQEDNRTPDPKLVLGLGGAKKIKFADAFADFSQKSFTAADVLQEKVNPSKGWAIGGGLGKHHELRLTLLEPQELGSGVLTIKLNHASQFRNLLLDHFRISLSSDPTVTEWIRMTKDVRRLVRTSPDRWSDRESSKVAAYYREITPLLESARKDLNDAQKTFDSMKPMTTVPVMRRRDGEEPRPTHVQIRGNYQSLGQPVKEGTPKAFHPMDEKAPRDRLALANWLVDDQNPLTPRVIANRHWEQLFGIGIVETSEEFGSQGELPSHPKLLDWLAVELRESGWDIKHLLKLMVMSSTYRQSSVTTADAIAADPFNRMLSRGPRFRVSAEMVRDQALFISGLLSEKLYGPPVNPPQPELGLKAAFGGATDWETSKGDDKYRRGIYTTWRRSSPYPSMAQFDAPNREVCTVRRIRTNTPLQALVTLNDPVYIEAAQAFARRVIDAADSRPEQIRFAFRQALTRQPTSNEVERISRLYEEVYPRFAENDEAATEMATNPIGPLPDSEDAAELATWTVICNAVLNLDELLMKR